MSKNNKTGEKKVTKTKVLVKSTFKNAVKTVLEEKIWYKIEKK